MANIIEANELKLQGNNEYQSREFDKAIKSYKKAYELNKDITYLNNLSAVYFEQTDYVMAITTAETAIEQGRETRQDFKLIAKYVHIISYTILLRFTANTATHHYDDVIRAFGRIGSAQMKLNHYEEAIKAFQKSLTEYRTPDILAKLKEVRALFTLCLGVQPR